MSGDVEVVSRQVKGMVTERDAELVRFVARFPFVTVELLRSWLIEVAGGGRTSTIVNTRLRVLEGLDLVETGRPLMMASRAVWCTRDGMRLAGLPGRSTPPRLGTFEHDLMVAWLAFRIMVDKPTHTLVTEREMRTFETPNQRGAGVEFSTPGSSPRRRQWPDLVSVTPSGAHVVHEVERTAKDHRRLVGLMLRHLSNPAVAGLRYYARPGAVLDRIERAGDEAIAAAHRQGNDTALTVVTYELEAR